MIPPFEFIALFEKESQISLLDQYVWRETARQIAEWRDRYGIVLPVSVNLSRVDVFDPNLESILDGMIVEYGLDRADLHLEVTESAYIFQSRYRRRNLKRSLQAWSRKKKNSHNRFFYWRALHIIKLIRKWGAVL